jgi:transcriptional regulator with XRE-family HTH domain
VIFLLHILTVILKNLRFKGFLVPYMRLIMSSFGKKLRECRENKDFSQAELARLIKSHHSIVGKYERDEVKPSIDVVKKMAEVLDTTVGYLLGEAPESKMLKDPAMLKRFNELNELPDKERECVYQLLDAFLAKQKLQAFLK